MAAALRQSISRVPAARGALQLQAIIIQFVARVAVVVDAFFLLFASGEQHVARQVV